MKIIHGGRNKGRQKAVNDYIESLPEEDKANVVFIKASDPLPKLRGNQLAKLRLLPIELYENENRIHKRRS